MFYQRIAASIVTQIRKFIHIILKKKETRETDKQTEIPFGEKKSKNLKSFIKSLPKNHQKFNSKYSRNTVHQLIRFILFIQTITKKKGC